MSYAVFSFLQSLQRTSGNEVWKRACWTQKKLAGSGSPLPKLWKVQSSCNSLTMSAGSAFWHEAWRRFKIQQRLPIQIPLLPLKIAPALHRINAVCLRSHKHGQDSWAYSGASRIWSDTCQASLPAQDPRTQAAGNMFLRLSWFCAPTCSILSPPASVTTAFNAKGLGKSWGLQWSAWHPASTNFSELWK